MFPCFSGPSQVVHAFAHSCWASAPVSSAFEQRTETQIWTHSQFLLGLPARDHDVESTQSSASVGSGDGAGTAAATGALVGLGAGAATGANVGFADGAATGVNDGAATGASVDE